MAKKKHEGGRPTVMTPGAIAKLEEAFLNDATILQACFLADISKDAYYDYIKLHPEFSDKIEMLRDDTKIKAKMAVRRAILSEEKPDTAKWYLEKRDKEFKPKQDITTDDKPLPIIPLNALSRNDSDQKNSQPEQKD